MKVWTFRIQFGEAVRIAALTQPLLDHPGGMNLTLWKMVGEEKEAPEIQHALEERGCYVQRYTEVQSAEQEAERRRLLGLPPLVEE